MKRARNLAVLGLVLLALAVLFGRGLYQPRRERPDGWRATWDAVPLIPESGWALDAPRREVIMHAFYESTPRLAHCNDEYFRGAEPLPTALQLLVDVKDGNAQLTYVIAEANAALPPGLLACIERALESTPATRHPQLEGKTERWRLGLKYLVHPPASIPEIPWWHRYVPEGWRNYGESSLHVG